MRRTEEPAGSNYWNSRNSPGGASRGSNLNAPLVGATPTALGVRSLLRKSRYDLLLSLLAILHDARAQYKLLVVARRIFWRSLRMPSFPHHNTEILRLMAVALSTGARENVSSFPCFVPVLVAFAATVDSIVRQQ